MKWTATICLKSGKYITVDELVSIKSKGGDIPVTNFKDFHLTQGTSLTFVGKTASVSLFSNEIEYVEFSAMNQ